MSPPPLTTWLETLRVVNPMEGALLVGAGVGTGSLVQWLLQTSPAYACLVEADPSQFQYLKRNVSAPAGWNLRCDTVAPDAAPLHFNRLSIPAESSLLSLSDLQTLWPNLNATDSPTTHGPRLGITLATLLAESTGPVNWLLLDCLPAAPLIQGAESALAKLDMILVRVVVKETLATPSARHSTVNKLLEAEGFHCVHLEPERHPALALALYSRNIHTTRTEKQQRIEQLEAEVNELQLQVRLQSEELTKAETQLSLIETLLLSGPPS